MKNSRFRLYTVLLLSAMPAPLMSQASFQRIGFLTDATSSLALDVSPDGQYVAGGSGGLAFIWSALTGIQSMGMGTGSAKGLASFGNAACGTLLDTGEAFRWTPGGGITSLGFLPGGGNSQGIDISDDGQVVTGASSSTDGSQGFIWTEGEGMTGLGDLPGGTFFSSVEGISGDGQVVVGWSRSIDNFGEAFRWTGAGGMTGLGRLPGFTSSVARGASFDGSVIVGSSTKSGPQGSIIEATMWSGGSISSLGVLAGGTHSRAYGVSGDGQVAVGTAEISTGPVAFIWDTVKGIRGLKDVLEFEYGLNLSGWNLALAYGVSFDGKVIVGAGINPSGQTEAWRAVLDPGKPLTIISPVENEVLGILTDYDILWTGEGVDTLRIEYSIDDGETYFFIASNVPADSNKHTWEAPPTPSDSCRLKLTDIDNSDVFAVSQRFRIKDYILTRKKQDGTYESFDPAVHGWRFANGDSLWPQTWWQQFDYSNGNDPFTGRLYGFTGAQSSDFPDWPLFVNVFGVEQCYVSGSGMLFAWPSAIRNWYDNKKEYGGSCQGFAISSFLAFDHKDNFLAEFPELPPFNNLFDLTANDLTHLVVNELWTHALGHSDNDFLNSKWDKKPTETLNEIKAMLLSEQHDNSPIYINDPTPFSGGAHALNPYKVEKDLLNPDIEYVYVYDSNVPGDRNPRITVDKAADTWDYSILNWHSVPGAQFILHRPASAYLSNAILPKASAHIHPATSKPTGLSEHMQIYHSDVTSIALTNPGGRQIGYDDNTGLTDNLLDAIPLVPLTGHPHPPVGFYVPVDAYTVDVQGYADPETFLSVKTDSRVLTFGYSDADLALRDHLHIDDGLAVCYQDQRGKTAHFQAILVGDNVERVFEVRDLALSQNDSLHFALVNQSDLEMSNVGGARSYDLNLLVVSTSGERLLAYDDIALAANSSHAICPVWEKLDSQPLTIYIDQGNDGTVDDSLLFENKTTNIDDRPGEVVPQNFFLYQNYPNPFNPSTSIVFDIPQREHVIIKIFNSYGQMLRTLTDAQYAVGSYSLSWDGLNNAGYAVASGIYLCRIEAGEFTRVMKMSLLR